MTDKDTTIDSQITDLFDVLEKQKEAVEASKKEIARSWTTNGSLQLPSSAPINITTANEETIIHAVAQLLHHQDFTQRAAEELGVKAPSKIAGYSYSSWIDDCKKRIASLRITQQKTKLTELETRLNLIVSPEQRRALELASIRKDLGI